MYHDSEKNTADETASQRKGLKIFLDKGRQGNNLQSVRNCCTQVLVPRASSKLFLILFSFNVRLFYHRNKFLPQCIVTWSIQNEITSFQIDSFPHRKNSQQRHWSGFATDDFVAWAYFTFRRLEETGSGNQ